ncbi:hypothetical protein R6V09_15175 [Streptomyces sp. W16]|uniref:hypothetical protein n=1 Tax=Streptomyces sp. W16 TaxID=3076631 RepID=UPI00295B8660|nr:hypothetical protein [Streptomyces sp. W16]MDV9171460.1 hypothetical protein [Streptomyces sp. W16]
MAAYDVHRATVFGRCEPKTGIVPFMSLVKQVMTQEPYAGAKRVFWIVDNGPSHRGQRPNRPSGRQVPQRRPGPHPGPRLLAEPFQWRFTTTDLDDLPARLDRHTLTDRQEESSVDLAA